MRQQYTMPLHRTGRSPLQLFTTTTSTTTSQLRPHLGQRLQAAASRLRMLLQRLQALRHELSVVLLPKSTGPAASSGGSPSPSPAKPLATAAAGLQPQAASRATAIPAGAAAVAQDSATQVLLEQEASSSREAVPASAGRAAPEPGSVHVSLVGFAPLCVCLPGLCQLALTRT